MNIKQFNAILPDLNAIIQAHGDLPAMRVLARADVMDAAKRCDALDLLELQVRMLAAGYEAASANEATRSVRIDAAKRCVAHLDASMDAPYAPNGETAVTVTLTPRAFAALNELLAFFDRVMEKAAVGLPIEGLIEGLDDLDGWRAKLGEIRRELGPRRSATP